MATGFGAFMEGVGSGIKTRSDMDFNRQYVESMRQRNERGALDLEGRRKSALEDYTFSGGTEEDFNQQWSKYQKAQDPALLRLGKFLGSRIKGFFGGGTGAGEEAGATQQMAISTPEVQMAGPQGNGVTTYGIPEYANGGRVRGYANGGLIEDEDEEGGGGIGAFMGDLGRNAADLAKSGFRNTIDAYQEGSRLNRQNRDYMMQEGISMGERGDRARSYAGDAIGGGARMLTGLADDVLGPIDEGVAAAGQFVGGFIGNETPEDKAATSAARQGVPGKVRGSGDKAAAVAARSDVPERTDEQVAQAAIGEAEVSAMENLDYKLLVDQGVSPEELPSMNTKDWSDYRREQFMALQMQGMNPKEAMQQVDYMTVDTQMRGFQREGQKALLYLQTGQSREAAMALRQAYQYFPNGVGVKFGMANDPKTGQPAIIALGVDEETGEPSGKPMIITTERLSAMMENMTNPTAFRAWTKDGRDLQIEIAKFEETGRHNRATEDIYRAGAITDRIKAQTAATVASGGGMKPSDVDRRSEDYRAWASDKELLGELDEGVAIALADAMDRVTYNRPDLPPNTVIKAVEDAWANGGELGVIELLNSLQAE